MPRHLTDRARVELAIPTHLLVSLVHSDGFVVASDEGEDPALARQALGKLRAILADSLGAVVADLPKPARLKILRRSARAALEAVRSIDSQAGLKLAMVLYYFVADLIDAGHLDLAEGSPVHEALDLFVLLCREGWGESRLDASAQKQARHLLAALQKAGWYGGPAALKARAA
ncbi:hypothetical protein [Methylobacterium sp. WSM2598]|uniref:hypothetical protein n=1 Tax=Methylobacterium sp. WSM2598 TaxID=398261 RepID=UPI0003620BFE|nr:hypothetical protein [Methylobacterium sp. WSM2598]